MAQEDKERWNKKYQDNKIPDEPIVLVQQYATSARGNQALDIACGMGRHSKYLASLGFNVDALDISSVAIEHTSKIYQTFMLWKLTLIRIHSQKRSII